MPIITRVDYKCDVCGKEVHDVFSGKSEVSDDWRSGWFYIQSTKAYSISQYESAKFKFTICRECCEKNGWLRPKDDVEAKPIEPTTGEQLVELISKIAAENNGQ